jgi:hypothetical protein
MSLLDIILPETMIDVLVEFGGPKLEQILLASWPNIYHNSVLKYAMIDHTCAQTMISN